MKLSVPDLLLATDGTVYVRADALNLAERHGRRVVRVLALTPRESKGIAAALTGVAPEAARRRGAAQQEAPLPREGRCPMKRAVDLADRRDVARWLDALAVAIGEAVDAGQDAARPARGRVVSRAHLRRLIREAARTARALLRAGRRGLGPMVAPASEGP